MAIPSRVVRARSGDEHRRENHNYLVGANRTFDLAGSLAPIGDGKQIANDLTIIRLVLDHRNALAHAASTCRSTITGSVHANVEP